MLKPSVVAAAALLAAAPAAATISDLSFHGPGVVTYSIVDTDLGIAGPAVGTPVFVTAHFHLGNSSGDPDLGFAPAPPNGFTGGYDVSFDELFYGYASFVWSVAGAGGASSIEGPLDYAGGHFQFVNGHVTSFSVGIVGDPDGHTLGSGTFSEDLGYYSTAQWGGVWAFSVDTVPEPASWTLMLAGFGVAGAAARRRQTLAA